MMKSIEKLENIISGWFKPLPHLPETITKWIATNLWWITLVGVILSAIGAVVMVFGVFAMLAAIGTVTSVYGLYVAPVYTGWAIAAAIVALVFLAGVILLMAMAISPLRLMKKQGWNLLFMVMLLQVLSIVVGAILNFDAGRFLSTIIGGLISLAVGTYLLYEIRSYFGSGVKVVSETK